MGAINVASTVIGFAQTIAIGSLFGATRTIEIFFAAMTLLATLQQLTNMGQVSAIFTPIFHDVRNEHGVAESRRAASAMVNTMVAFTTFLAFFAMVFSGGIASMLVPGYQPKEIVLCSQVFFILSPLIVARIYSGVCGGVLRAEKQFFVTELVLFLSRLVNLVVLLLLASSTGIWALVWGVWAATGVEFIGLSVVLFWKGYRPSIKFYTDQFSPMIVITKVPFSFAHILANQFAVFVSTAAFSTLDAGPYAIFRYAKLIHAKIQGAILQPVAVVFFNQFSDAKSTGQKNEVKLSEQAFGLAFAIVSLYMSAIIVSGDFILAGLFGGEKFTLLQIQQCYVVIVCLALLLVVNVHYLVAQRANLASKVIFPQYTATSVVLFLSGVASYWIIPAFGLWGGLAIHVASVVGAAGVSMLVMKHYNPQIKATISTKKLGKWFLCVLSTTVIFFAIRSVLGLSLSANRWQLFFIAAILGASAVTVCTGLALMMGLSEIKDVFIKLREKFAKLFGRVRTL